MFFHVMLGANDLEAAKTFYDAALGALDIPSKGQFRADPQAYMYGDPQSGLFFITKPMNGEAATHANGGTVMFRAKDRAAAEAFYAAGLAAGGRDVNGPPAPGGVPGSIMGYLRDPCGNKISVIAFT